MAGLRCLCRLFEGGGFNAARPWLLDLGAWIPAGIGLNLVSAAWPTLRHSLGSLERARYLYEEHR